MTRSKKGRAPRLDGQIPDKVRDLTRIRTYWDNGNIYVEPDVDGTYMLQLSLVQRKDVAAFIFSKVDGVATDFNQANVALLHELGDLGIKLLAAQTLSFNDSNDAADATDGELHVAITPDATTVGQYDIATHHPPWITAADLPPDTDDDNGLVSKTPTSGNPNSMSATGTQLLSGATDRRALDVASSGGFAVVKGAQSGSTAPSEAPIVLVRDPQSLVPFVSVQPSTQSDPGFVAPVNGFGEIAARAYSSLPSNPGNHLGAIIRITANPDLFYMAINTPLGPAWAQFVGPAGANGSNGTNGVTPQLQVSGAYIQVSYDGGATWSNLLPLGAITGPTGATGATGAQGPQPVFNTPAAFSDPPLRVDLVGNGSPTTPYHLTFHIPSIVSAAITPPTGLTVCDASEAIGAYVLEKFDEYQTNAANTGTSNETAVTLALTMLSLMGELGTVTSFLLSLARQQIGGVTPATIRSGASYAGDVEIKNCLYCVMTTASTTIFDASIAASWAALVNTTLTNPTSYVEAIMNFIQALDPGVLYLVGGTAVPGSADCSAYDCPPVAPSGWHAHIDFTVSNGGFAPIATLPGNWVSGSGWEESTGASGAPSYVAMYPIVVLDSCAITRVKLTIAAWSSGSANPATEQIGLGFSSAGVYDRITDGVLHTPFPEDWIWDGGTTSHYVNPSAPITTTSLYFQVLTSDNGGGGSATVSSIDIFGNGTPPSQLSSYLV